jgi:hypothetical protein
MSRRPTLVCVNNATDTLTRYIPKVFGGFFTEVFKIVDRDAFDKSLTPETVERVRLGFMEGQETPPELDTQEQA